MYTKFCLEFTDNQINICTITNRNVLLIKLNHILSISLIKVRENSKEKQNKTTAHKTKYMRGSHLNVFYNNNA